MIQTNVFCQKNENACRFLGKVLKNQESIVSVTMLMVIKYATRGHQSPIMLMKHNEKKT